MSRIIRFSLYAAALAALLGTPAGHARAQGYPGYPYTIMTPERPAGVHRGRIVSRKPHARTTRHSGEPSLGLYANRSRTAPRGSSGSVLPTPLPRTALIPPEGGTAPILQASPGQQGATVLPGTSPIPNLPHGPETFQDRASRCAFQQGLYNVPGTLSNQYMGACVQ